MRLDGHVALVTGANRGIGARIARALANAGAAVGVHYHSAADRAAQVVADITAAGGRAVPLRADIRVRDEVRTMVEALAAEFGPVDILVNNARQIGAKKKFLDLTWADYEPQIDVILKGAFHCCQATLPSMIERGKGGRIVNILSTITEEPNWRWHTYGAAKGALAQLTRHLAAEMGPHGITVNMVSPGFTRTERQSPHADEYLKDYLEHTPLGRFVHPEDVAHAVAFLASEEAGFITGANLPVSGGKVVI
jgi:3-oxoacyl-[acyl-carrier protein] reductase